MAYGYGSSRYNYDPFSSLSFSYDFSRITPVAKPATTAAPKPIEPEFKAGDKVTVKLETTAEVLFVNSGGDLDIKLADGTEMDYFPAKYTTLQDPDNWPPTVGQVWKANGKNFGVRKNSIWPNLVAVYQVDQPTGTSYSKGNGPGATLDDFKKLRPTLVG